MIFSVGSIPILVFRPICSFGATQNQGTFSTTHFSSQEMRFKSKLLSFQTMSAWKTFQDRYPYADLSRFTQTDWFGDSGNNVYFKSKDGEEEIQVFGRGKFIYGNFTKKVKKALDIITDFLPEPFLNASPKLPVPALGHADKPRTFDFPNLEIFVTPTDSFKMKFRDVFADTKLTHHSAKESHRWLNSPDMNYWPQQLNFAVWCATTGSGGLVQGFCLRIR